MAGPGGSCVFVWFEAPPPRPPTPFSGAAAPARSPQAVGVGGARFPASSLVSLTTAIPTGAR